MCDRKISWYFIQFSTLKSYDVVCNDNIESKRVPEKKRLYYYLPANITNQIIGLPIAGITDCVLID